MKLEDLKRICDEATPGPWECRAYDEDTGHSMLFFGQYIPGGVNPHVEIPEPDAEFIATFNPALVVKLLALVELAEDVIDTSSDCQNSDGTEYCGHCPICRLGGGIVALGLEK